MSRELNLLPPDRRQLLDNKLMLSIVNRFMRMLLITLSAVMITGIIAIVLLKGMIFASSDLVEDNLKSNITRYQQIREEIAKKNEIIKVMHTASNDRIMWSDNLESLFLILPPNTIIAGMSGTSAEQGRLHFSGTAITRNSLIVLEDRLSELEWIKEVIAPQSNLLERDNPEYRFDLTLNRTATQEAENTIE